MNATERVSHHELGTQQSDAVHVHRGDLLGVLGERQIGVETCRQGQR